MPEPTPQRLPHVSFGALNRYRRLMALLQRLSPALAARVGLSLFLRPSRRRPDARDLLLLGQAHRSTLRCAGQKLCIYQWGNGARQAVLVHGWGSHAPRFAPLVEALLKAGWRVTAFDAPAHGESTGRRSSLPQFQQALLAVLARQGAADVLIGHSLGALAIALTLGEGHVAPPPRGAVLISMPRGVPFLLGRYQEMFGIGPATAARFGELFLRRFGHQPEHYAATHLPARLPLLFIHDKGDDVVPVAHSIELAASTPDAQLHLTQGLGHSGLLRDPDTIDVIVHFAQGLVHD
ncbi:MAG: alpha/beta fold hydrolase [Steroidobacteraceae bacterium]